MEQFANGPYLQAAFFCERLLEESDGVLSAIRIVDTVTIQDEERLSEAQAPLINLTLFIAFKAGEARGSFDLTVVMEEPTDNPAHAQEQYSQTLDFYGTEDRGVTVIMPATMTVGEEGIYWFGIYLGEQLVTRLPLRVVVLRGMPPNGPQ
jgi:hypothetical protein